MIVSVLTRSAKENDNFFMLLNFCFVATLLGAGTLLPMTKVRMMILVLFSRPR